MRKHTFVAFYAISLFHIAMFASGCGHIIEPGHRGLLFNSRRGGLRHGVLMPGYHYVGAYGRVDDFDVTYSTRKEEIHTTSSEGLAINLRVAVIYRPIISEMYELDTEIGGNYYDEVVGPEFRSATRGVFSRHPYLDLQKQNEKIEDEVESELRRRIAGKHVEISSVTMEQVDYAPEIASAIRGKLVGEQEAIRNKAVMEYQAFKSQQELEHEAERQKTRAEAELSQKKHEHTMAEEQAAIDRVRAETAAATQVIAARAEAEQTTLIAKAHAEERRAERSTLTPLAVMAKGYEALAKLGGTGTTILMGDFSKAPAFLFPHLVTNPFGTSAAGEKPVAARPRSGSDAVAEGEVSRRGLD